jgi:hypothetical protein
MLASSYEYEEKMAEINDSRRYARVGIAMSTFDLEIS